ncbi:hypothetical protein ASG29_10395 [Sphingomonas sp. Leaf412]|uniref:ATP-binding protein n=1 Tax=Sphingomonas sp. Leaf412 TaxID=1736370 RepID=UPI0007018439|nr:ATP-binding protein [Sphingomonas sp. Leaf412]KQT32226.1 hypothetical protein ASG29_10395 [Sphingomonas sp. Leaf412]
MAPGLALLFALTATGATASAADFDRAISRARENMLVAPAAAAAQAQAALRTAGQAPTPTQRATVLWLRGEAFNRLGRTEEALPLLIEARRLAEGGRTSLLLADILLSEGSALTDAGRITVALATLQRAHEAFLTLKQGRSRAKALILIAMMYDAGRDHEAALRYFRQAQNAYAVDPGLLVAIHYGRGTALHALGRWPDAEREFVAALKIAVRMGAPAVEAQAWSNIANERLSRGDVASAEQAIRTGLAIAHGGAAVAVRPQLLAFAADAALRRDHVARAAALIGERFDGVDLSRTIIADRDAHEVAYRIYLADGAAALALRHLTALKRLDDQATQIARSTGAALAAARFDYANQELRIAKLKATDLARRVAFERAAARTQLQIFAGVAIATALLIVLLAVGLFTIRRSRDRVRAANADLATTNGKLEKALAAKTEFLATTSHEIRTPLNGILGMTQVMIADPALDAATRDRLAVVHGAGTTMRALVDDILDVAKIETGKMTVERVPIDLVVTVDDAARIWRDQASAKGLAFETRCDMATRWVMGDAARLRQIVFNLLSNAVKFTADGGIVLTLEETDGRIRLSVSDTGIGIAEPAHELIFESFRQADAGTTRQFGGTGLGLSICRNLARAMDGDVTVASRAGEGATFLLDLPLLPADVPGADVAPAGLLVVERNPITRAMFATLFAALDPVVFAGDAIEAMRTIADRTPARILVVAGSLGGDPRAALRRLLDAAGPGIVSVLIPAGTRGDWPDCGSARLIERPVGKRELVTQVMERATPLVPQAA